jgi:transposase
VRQQFKERGSLKPQTDRCGRKTLLNVKRMERLRKLIEAQPDATLAELGRRMDRPFGTSTIDLWVRKLGLSYKKNALRRGTKPARRKGDARDLA